MTDWLTAVVTALASTSVLSVVPDPVPGLWIKGSVGHTLRLSLLFTLNLSPANEAHCHSRTRQRQGRCCAVYITYSVSIIMMSWPLLLSVFRLNWSESLCFCHAKIKTDSKQHH